MKRDILGLYILIILVMAGVTNASAQLSVSANERRVIRGGIASESVKIEPARRVDSLAMDSLAMDSLAMDSLMVDSLDLAVDHRPANSRVTNQMMTDSLASDSLAKAGPKERQKREPRIVLDSLGRVKDKLFADSMSLSKMAWSAAIVPGYGQIYNKQYWKLPIVYGAMAAGVSLFLMENKTYKPLKEEYDAITFESNDRTAELNALQGEMIRSNTRRQIYMGATIASYIYAVGDAAVNYATNDVSGVKRATTLATICPGAGQIYNGSYWKVPFVVGGFASMIYVVDWNNRGYKRFKTAYNQLIAYDADPDAYPDGSPDEFNGRYTSDYMKSIRDSYRRNRDLSLLMLAGLYILQIVDAHVDAHFKDFDV